MRPFAPMKQVGCRLLNQKYVPCIIVLIVFSILFILRLLSSESSESVPPTSELILPLPPVYIQPPPVACPVCNSSNPSLSIDTRLGHWDNRRLVKMFDSVLVGDLFVELSQRHKVSIATQCSLEKIDSLVQLADRWNGPISVALFAVGDHEYMLIQGYIHYLRRCYRPVREQVTFHLMFPKQMLPRPYIIAERTEHLDCLEPQSVLHELMEKRPEYVLQWKNHSLYPQNHMRNLARKNCQTPYVFLIDIDIIPCENLAEKLDTFLTSAQCDGNKCVYVIPTYELDNRVHFPTNKSDLLQLANRSLAQPFHKRVFIPAQLPTNYSRWKQDFEEDIHVSHNVTDFKFLYEPFYVAPDTVPPHDERFIGYGYTRNTQVYETYMAGYQFQVLSPVFTCHWGMLRRGMRRPKWRLKQTFANSRQIKTFKSEIWAKYKGYIPPQIKP